MTFEEIGQKLRAARDASGLTLGQIQQRTKIPFSHLESIDNGNVEDLPEPVYVSGFIKRYAECVGLDPQELAHQYKEVLEGNHDTNGKFRFFAKPNKEPSRSQIVAGPVYYKNASLSQPAPNPLKSLPFYALWVVVVLSLVTFLVNRQTNTEQQDPSVLTLKQTAEKMAPAVVSPPPATASTESSDDSTKDDNEVHISITASQHVWIEIKSVSSGDTVFTGVLERGDRKDFQDQEGLRVIADNGGAISVERNGSSATLGSPGKKAEKVYAVKEAADLSGKKESQAAEAGEKKPQTTPAKKPEAKPAVAAKPVKRFESLSTHRQLPGDSLNSGGQGLDVPYRY